MLSLISGAVKLSSAPLKLLVKLIANAVSAIRKGVDTFIDLGSRLGVESLKELKTQRELNRVIEARNAFEEDAIKKKEEMQTFLRQQAVQEYDSDINRRRVNKLTFEEQRQFWEDHKRHLGLIKMQNKDISDKEARERAMEAAAIDFRIEHFKVRKNADKTAIKDAKTKAELDKARAAAQRKAEKERREREKKAKKEAKGAIKEASQLIKTSLIDVKGLYEKAFTPFEQAIVQYDLIIKKQKELEEAQESGASIAVVKEMSKELAYINGEHTKTLGLLSEQQMQLFNLRTAFKNIGEEEAPKKKDEETPEQKAQRIADENAMIRGAIVDSTQMTSDAIFNINASRIDALEEKRMASIDRMFNREVEQARGNSVLIEQAEAKRIKKQEALEAEMNKKRKRQAIAQATINGALAITKIFAEVPKFDFGVATYIQAGLAAASTATQIATISSQQFAKGGVINGPSHAQGGVPVYGAGGKFAEVEGGEAIINKRSTAMFKPVLSAINVAGGGKKFAQGGLMPSMERIAENAGFDINAETNLVSQAIAKLTDRQPVVVLDTFAEEQNKLDNYNKTKVQ